MEGTEAAAVLDTPLGRLLGHAMWASGGSRSVDCCTPSEHRLEMFSWIVVPRQPGIPAK